MNISHLYCSKEIGEFSPTEDALFLFQQLLVFLILGFSFSCNIILLIVVLGMQRMNAVRFSYINIIVSDVIVILDIAGVQVQQLITNFYNLLTETVSHFSL